MKRVPVIAAAALALSLALPAGASACLNANKSPAKLTPGAGKRATICVMNKVRARHGLRKLKANRRLSRAARRHSLAMDRDNYFSHTSLGGATFVDRILKTGYLAGSPSWGVGENLQWGSGGLGTPKMAVVAWLKSPPHRETLLARSWEHVGVGIALGSPDGTYEDNAAIYTADFGYH